MYISLQNEATCHCSILCNSITWNNVNLHDNAAIQKPVFTVVSVVANR